MIDLSGHRERLRQRVEKEGLESLRPREIVELLLCYAIPMRDLSDLSRLLLDRFGSISGILKATEAELKSVSGVGDAVAQWLMTVSELLGAYLDASAQPQMRITCLQEALICVKPTLELWKPPTCGVLFTDFEDRLMLRAKLCEREDWAAPECARECLLQALAMDARRAVLVLRRDEADFTDYDRTHAVTLANALKGVGVTLRDCICAGDTGWRSLAEEGGLNEET